MVERPRLRIKSGLKTYLLIEIDNLINVQTN